MTEQTVKSSDQLYREWREHRFFRYRGCAPHPDDPMRMAGDPDLHVGAHHGPDAFVAEGQKERRAREAAAIEVCLNCPIMVACDAYASSVRPDGKLAEPDGVWGGRRSLERHKALITRRVAAVAAPDRQFQTAQKQAVLRALAGCWDPFEVAAAAGVDVRTANWQRSSLVRLLGLPKGTSRMRALAAARERGLLEGLDVVADDGSVPAVPPPTKTTVPAEPTQLGLWGGQGDVKVPATRRRRRSVRRPARVRARSAALVPTLDDALNAPEPAPGLARVIPLFPANHRLEAAV